MICLSQSILVRLQRSNAMKGSANQSIYYVYIYDIIYIFANIKDQHVILHEALNLHPPMHLGMVTKPCSWPWIGTTEHQSATCASPPLWTPSTIAHIYSKDMTCDSSSCSNM
jgi:hypothetical protein